MNNLIKILLIGIVFIIGLLGLGYMHEQVHVEIFRHDGIDSHVEYSSHFPDFVTIPEEACKTETCRLSHNINEVVGYHLLALYVAFASYIILKNTFEEVEKLKKEFEEF